MSRWITQKRRRASHAEKDKRNAAAARKIGNEKEREKEAEVCAKEAYLSVRSRLSAAGRNLPRNYNIYLSHSLKSPRHERRSDLFLHERVCVCRDAGCRLIIAIAYVCKWRRGTLFLAAGSVWVIVRDLWMWGNRMRGERERGNSVEWFASGTVFDEMRGEWDAVGVV